jgi:tetratricopeptide (TPR) repeat protein
LARQAIDRAIELYPDLPEAHYAMGFYQYHYLGDTEAALREWSIAAQGMPGDSRLYLARSYVYRRTGDFEQAVRNQDKAIELDPRNIEQLLVQWHTYSHLRDYQQAKQFADRIIEIQPDRPFGYILKSYLPIWRDGNFDAAYATLENAPMYIPAYWFRWTAAIYERDYETALGTLEGWKIDVDDRQFSYTPKATYYGMTHQLSGMPGLATDQFQVSRTVIELELQKNPKDPRLLIALGEVQAALMQPLLAIDSAKNAMNLVPRSLDAMTGPATHLSAILILVAAGDYDSAIEELDTYLASPGVWSIEGLLPDPRLDPIRDDPRFEALVAKSRR